MMKLGKRALPVLLCCLCALAGAAPALNPISNPALDRQLTAIVADPSHAMASLSVLAIRDGKVSYQGQFGARHLPSQLPVTPETLFRIASISKMMTTLAVMKLVEDGKLALDADVGTYLGYALRNPHFPDLPVTLRSLLSHTSSLRDNAGYSWGIDVNLRDIFDGDTMWATNAGPGAYFSYANLNWGVIGTVMEKVTGERFDRLMRRLLLAPMGLHGGYNPAQFSAADLANTATLYRKRTVDTEVWNPDGPWIAQADDFHANSPTAPSAPAGLEHYIPGANGTLFSPTGGLRISAADMGRIMLMLINHGMHEGRQILAPASIALMFTRQWQLDDAAGSHANGDTSNGLFRAWGLGNQQFDDGPGHELVAGGAFNAVGHLGDAYGLLSAFVFDPLKRDGMVVLIGGTGSDPENYPGRHSALSGYQEAVLDALYHAAIACKTLAPK